MKKSETDFELFLISHLFNITGFEKSVLHIFVLLYMNVISEPISYSWNFGVVIWVDFEKNII